MLSESIRYLSESDDAVRTVLIGGLLTLFSPLLVPAFGVFGYLVRVLDRTADGDDAPPVFDDWGALFADGLKAFVVAFAYWLVPTVLGGAIVVLGLGLGAAGDSGALGALGVFVGGLVWFALALAAAYVVPAALANYADHRTVGSGFAFGRLWPTLSSRTYLVGWAYAAALVLAGGLVSGVLNGVPVLGTVAGAFVGFYALVAAFRVLGHTWADLHPVTVREDEVPGERPAV